MFQETFAADRHLRGVFKMHSLVPQNLWSQHLGICILASTLQWRLCSPEFQNYKSWVSILMGSLTVPAPLVQPGGRNCDRNPSLPERWSLAQDHKATNGEARVQICTAHNIRASWGASHQAKLSLPKCRLKVMVMLRADYWFRAPPSH